MMAWWWIIVMIIIINPYFNQIPIQVNVNGQAVKGVFIHYLYKQSIQSSICINQLFFTFIFENCNGCHCYFIIQY